MAHPAPLNRAIVQDSVQRGRTMEAMSKWPVADQLRLARQIMGDVAEDPYQRMEGRKAAVIALDAIDETEAEMGWARRARVAA